MDKVPDLSPDQPLTAGPPSWHGPAELLGALVVALVLLGLDSLGRLLGLPAVAALLVIGLRDQLHQPVLTADATGLTVVDGLRRRAATWPEVDRLRVVKDRRTPLLEIDLGERVVVVSQRRLGRPAQEVLEALELLSSGREGPGLEDPGLEDPPHPR